MKQPLDKLLRDWAASHEPDAAARRQLEARVVRAARRKLHNGGPAPVPAPRHRPSPRQLHHLLWFAAGMAATILIAVVWHLPPLTRPPAPAASPLAEERGLFVTATARLRIFPRPSSSSAPTRSGWRRAATRPSWASRNLRGWQAAGRAAVIVLPP